MNYYEYIGPPGSGKTTKMSKDFINHKNLVIHNHLFSYVNFFRDFFFLYKIYKLKNIKRLVYSTKHLYSILFANSNLVLDQGLVQIYLSHCSENNIALDQNILDHILEIIRSIFIEVNFIFIGEELQLEKINLRLEKRNKNRKDGLSESFLLNFKNSIKFFKKYINKD